MNIMAPATSDLDDLYARYSARLLAAAAERLAEIGPSALDLDEDVTQDVWAHIAEHGLPDGLRGLDALLFVLDHAVARVRRHRGREIPSGIAIPARRTAHAVSRDTLDTPIPGTRTNPALPATVSAALAALHALSLAG
ncbi:hypothetical protein [Kitasatospora arboriphila]|uniref:Sigma-70 family RNA polymerase sigma factor n=1 Tax=Kitasatospora arboriphila TaxID=258052 RepID=A0ABN1TZ23_9ACTN